jgi:hypothetical protein
MRKLLGVSGLVCGLVLTCAGGALAQEGKVDNGWACGKPASANSIDVGDMAGHAYGIDQIKCTSPKGEIAGVREKEGTGTEFMEVKGNKATGHGIFVETMTNGDKLTFNYQLSGTMENGMLKSGTDKWQAVSGTGKFKGIKGSGTCTGTGTADGGANWTCAGTYTLPMKK